MLFRSKEKNLPLSEVCFVGNDLPDIECIKKVGFSVAVAYAENEVKKAADYVTKKNGGYGAVREICEYLTSIRKEKKL